MAERAAGRPWEAFVYDEAELLDDGHFARWLDLFDDEAVYWLPVDTSRSEPTGGINLIYDDRRRLEGRIQRLLGGYSFTEEPISRTSHLIGNVRLVDHEQASSLASWIALDPDDVLVTARTVVSRLRRGTTDVFPGRCTWILRPGGPFGYRIALKRMDLLHADQPLPALTFLL
jgi:3-phenylpropionate/cinnamic acid dioxygenase small subunit